jgi:hypothetical protein
MPIRCRSRHLTPALLLAISACSDSTHPAPPPGSPAAVTAVAGDAQTGTPGQALPGALTVLVADSAGRPVPGVSVAWAVEDDGGSVNAASSVTGADGRATATWTLGSYIGAWSATARAGDLDPVVFHATANGPLHVSIVSPTPGTILPDPYQAIHAQVTSTAPVAEVKAATGTTETSLFWLPGNAPDLWVGVPPVTGTAGPRRIRVVARDSAGHQALASVMVTLDLPLRIRVLAPLGWPLWGRVPVRAQCVDDTPGNCRSLEAFVRAGATETRVAQGTDSVSTEYAVADANASSMKFVFRATDAAGAVTTVETPELPVVTGPWTQVASVDGVLLDASPERALYVTGAFHDELLLRDLVAGTDRPLAHESNIGPELTGWVTPAGAIVDFGDVGFGNKPEGIREWGGSNAGDGSGHSPQAAGRWAAYQLFGRVFRDDVLAPSLTSTPASLYADGGYDLAEDGTVAMGARPTGTTGCCLQLYAWSGAAATPLTSDTFDVVGPVTDGSAFVYAQQLQTGTPRMLRLVYHDAGGAEEALTPFFHRNLFVGSGNSAVPGRTYQIRNGWVAFEYPDGADTYHAYVRTPSGDVHAVWPGAPAGARLVTVGPQGEVVMIAGGTLYLVNAPHATGTSIGSLSPIHHVKWIAGKLYIVTGGGLFRFDG